MRRCKDCKHWDKHDGECNNVLTICRSIPTVVSGQDAALHYYASDDQDLDAYLITGLDYGCVNFRKRIER